MGVEFAFVYLSVVVHVESERYNVADSEFGFRLGILADIFCDDKVALVEAGRFIRGNAVGFFAFH